MVEDLSKQNLMVLIQCSLTCASNIMVVGLTRSNHSCIFTTYIDIILFDKNYCSLLLYGVRLEKDLMVLVSVN